MEREKSLYTLIPLEEFKALLGIDDREDKIARFCLVTATFTIEQYCKRKLLRKKHFETIGFCGDLILPLKEYPVSKIIQIKKEERKEKKEETINPDDYYCMPDLKNDEDIPFSLVLRTSSRLSSNTIIKVLYFAGYAPNNIPADLSAACMEFAAWHMNRYRGRRIGMTGNVRGAGKDGEHFEMSMPENVRALLEELYRRKTI
jgi:hypothetical protein